MKINKRVIIVLFAAFISTLSISAISKHPFHVGVVNVSYSPKQKTFQLSFKFFDHDFEQALKT